MTKRTIISTAILALASIAGAASAQDVITTAGTHWGGFFVGGNIGGAWNNTCNTWEPGTVITGTPVLANTFYNRNCPNNGTFIGGVQLGYMFQSDQWVWGLGLDYEIWSAKNHNRSFTYTGAPPPPDGTYAFSGKNSPNGLILLGPRVGYSIDQWLPYFRIGGVFTSGSHTSTASFTDANGTSSFTGGKNYNSSGFNAGFGLAYALGNQWALAGEYNYINLGKGKNTVTTCTGSAATCAEFGNLSLNNIHNSLTANMFRVSINYGF